MAKMCKRVRTNKILLEDKRMLSNGESKCEKPISVRAVREANKLNRKTDYISKDDLEKIVNVARAHALWLHLTVLKRVFGFSSAKLIEYHSKLPDVYKYAIDDKSVGGAESIVVHTVRGSSKVDSGNMDMPEYEFRKFDADGEIYKRYVTEADSIENHLLRYKKLKRCFTELDKCDVAGLLVLKDNFGFAKKRLSRFIEKIREPHPMMAWRLYEDKIAYLEKLCNMKFKEFDCIRNGQGISWQTDKLAS